VKVAANSTSAAPVAADHSSKRQNGKKVHTMGKHLMAAVPIQPKLFTVDF
jgi:hypothetical protein